LKKETGKWGNRRWIPQRVWRWLFIKQCLAFVVQYQERAMAYQLASNEVDWPNDAPPAVSSAALIRVPASAQQAPDALRSCPVCGQPYTAACVVALPPQASARLDERLVLLCPRCDTYAVGLLEAQPEEKVPY
jgi:hypothetical protein